MKRVTIKFTKSERIALVKQLNDQALTLKVIEIRESLKRVTRLSTGQIFANY